MTVAPPTGAPEPASPPRSWPVTALIWFGGLGFLLALATLPLTDRGSLTGVLAWVCLGLLPLYLVAVWLAGRRPDHPQTRRLLLVAAIFPLGVLIENAVSRWYSGPESDGWLFWVNLAGSTVNMIGLSVALLLFATYPDGVVERAWQQVLVRFVMALPVLPTLWVLTNPAVPLDTYLTDMAPGAPTMLPSPLFVPALAPIGPVLLVLNNPIPLSIGAIGVLLYRFRTAPAEQRRRMRLMTYSLVAGLPVLLTVVVLQAAGVPDDAPVARAVSAFLIPIMLAMPVSIVIGVLRYRLFDIEVIVRRSVVYGLLVLLIAIAYGALAVAPGLALGDQVPVQLAVALTVVAAIAFQPLRRRLERLADRWVFGERVNRYRLLTDFGSSLEHAARVPDLLPTLARTVQEGLRAPWVRVTVTGMPVAIAGPDGDEVGLTVPLEHRRLPDATPTATPTMHQVGRIDCGVRPDGYDEQDRELLATLAGQAASAIANVRLSTELAERLAELDRSRARIVTAADAERRRIERDIHDGVQQQVVALIMKVRLARNQIGRAERAADDALAEIGVDVKDLLIDLRELAHGIHPPVLSDGGLLAAVEARAARLPFAVRVSAGEELRDRRFADDVEGAAYFVVCEALTNVAKHAGDAGPATEVDLADGNGELTVVIADHGAGFADPSPGGTGLTNLRDRVEALGGRLRVDSAPGRGTRVSAHLPVGTGHG